MQKLERKFHQCCNYFQSKKGRATSQKEFKEKMNVRKCILWRLGCIVMELLYNSKNFLTLWMGKGSKVSSSSGFSTTSRMKWVTNMSSKAPNHNLLWMYVCTDFVPRGRSSSAAHYIYRMRKTFGFMAQKVMSR